MLIDLENLQANIPPIGPEGFSFASGFDRVMKDIARTVGVIDDVFVFSPPHLIQLYGEEFYWQGFTIIACPKVRAKDGSGEIDTVDQTLIDFGKKAIREKRGITHLCLGSGDKDFAPLVREAIRKRMKILIVASSIGALSAELIKLADERGIFLFSPRQKSAE